MLVREDDTGINQFLRCNRERIVQIEQLRAIVKAIAVGILDGGVRPDDMLVRVGEDRTRR